jgi:hypothetical protein
VERLELSHDLLTGVVRASRDRRREFEEAERQRFAAQQLQEEQKRSRELRDLKRIRGAAVVFLLLAVIALGSTWVALRLLREARSARTEAEASRALAQREGERANVALDMIKRSLLIRQAALSGDEEGLHVLLSSLNQSNSIRFAAMATDLHYVDSKAREVFNIELYPEPASIPTGSDAIAIVTYFANHPTFRNTLLTAGPGRQFRASYIGWGCLPRVVALVEYKDPTKPATVSEFDMCKSLGWP